MTNNRTEKKRKLNETKTLGKEKEESENYNNNVGNNLIVSNSSGSSFCYGLLKEIWLHHIFIYFNNNDNNDGNEEEKRGNTKMKKRIRSVCKLFYQLINQTTKWRIDINNF